jgi:hypothetical protein
MSERVCWACDRPAIVGYDLVAPIGDHGDRLRGLLAGR